MPIRYVAAVMRSVPRTIAQGQSRDESGDKPDYDTVCAQWEEYATCLEQTLGAGNVYRLPADDATPDCMFIEDTAVVVGSTVLITQLGHPTRRSESRVVREFFKTHAPGYKIVNMVEQDAIAFMDGGDVLFTGREFFVGQSDRTDQRGLKVLQNTFPEYPVHPISVQGALHLKSIVTMATSDCMVTVDNEVGHQCMRAITSTSSHLYSVIYVPDFAAANVVYVNGALFMPNDCPASRAILQQRLVECAFPSRARARAHAACRPSALPMVPCSASSSSRHTKRARLTAPSAAPHFSCPALSPDIRCTCP